MSSASERREAVRRQIEAAFADAVYPGDGRIAENPRCCPECAECDDWFRGRDWRQMALSGKRLPNNYAGLCFLSAEAWRYFLPAYALAGLRDESDDAFDAADNALLSLIPEEEGDRLQGWFPKRASGFNAEQRAAFAAFLDLLHAEHPDWFLPGDYVAARDYWAGPAG